MEKLPEGINNQSLFSDYYLTELVKDDDFFKRSRDEIENTFNKIKGIYEREKRFLTDGLNEAETERRFIRPVLNALGYIYSLQPTVHSPEGIRRPDFAFFAVEEDLEETEKRFKGKNEYFTKAISVGDAKQWGRSLDKKVKGPGDPFTNHNPSYQIDFYLRATDKRWGILTNGKHWRLYNRDTSYRLDIFYEVDLPTLLEAEDYEAFLCFYVFFRKEAFTEGFLERAYKESLEYTSRLGDELKENVYEALRLLAEGFLRFPGNNLSENDLDLIRENTFVLIYRILFILYAEDRGLLPLDKPEYQSYSLRNLAKDIAEKLDRSAHLSSTAQGYWAKLQDLCRMINEGDDYTKVPPYNGGLFDNGKHPFLTTYKVGDSYLARAIDQLTRAEASGRTGRGFISYRDMEIRHIGSIYEGLLEHHLKVASDDIAVVRGNKGKETFIPKTEVGGRRTIKSYNKGEVFLETDKGERKATGSYYTPDYIVKYIVSNTLGPLLEDKKKAFSERAEFLKERLKDPALRGAQKNAYKEELRRIESGTTYLEEILKTKVLDPAMGSGHFLVEATDFLARELVKSLGESPDEAPEDDIRWARREVVEKCIFGVDLNPLAVELAKLSLWLYTVAKNRPLSFLDHHLRCGNSLIGAWIKDLGNLPVLSKKAKIGDKAKQITTFEYIFRQKVNILLKAFSQIEMMPSNTVEDIKEKEKLYEEFRKIVRRFQDVADVWISVYFGNEVTHSEYDRLQEKLSASEEEWEKLQNSSYVNKALEIARDKRFFHWELEFPEVFFEGHQRKDYPGFDVVVGNPPYLRIQELQKADSTQVYFFNETFASAKKNYDIYVLFNEQGLNILREMGRLGMIQLSKFIQADFGIGIRSLLPRYLDKIIDFRQNQIFDVSTYTCLLFLAKNSQREWGYFTIHPLNDVEKELSDILNRPMKFSTFERNSLTDAPWVLADDRNLRIIEKINQLPDRLEDVVSNIFVGLQTSADNIYFLENIQRLDQNLIRVFSKATDSEWILETDYLKPLLKGEDVHRYEPLNPKIWVIFPYDLSGENPRLLIAKEIQENSPRLWEYLKQNEASLRGREHGKMNHDRWYAYIYPKNLNLYSTKKLITPEISFGCNITIDLSGYCHNTKCYSFLFKEEILESELYWLAVLNSNLLWFFLKSSGYILRGGYFTFKTNYLKPFPIRRISFKTSKAERRKLLEKGKSLYEDCMKKEDDKYVIEFVEHHLSVNPERSDVVHDLLAFLAEQMIEMNKEKQKEIKGLLTWLEGYSGAKIDDLTNKTRIKSYYELSWEDLLEVLEENRRRINKVDVTRREPQEKIKKEFEDSLSKLKPLLSRVQATDDLIDQIVYKLYGLTEEEIKIVEGQV